MAFWTSVGLGAFLVAALAYRAYVSLVKPRPIPGIPHWPVKPMGDVAELKRTVATTGARSYFFDETARQLGPISQAMIGATSLVIVADAQEIEDIVMRRSHEFDRSQRAAVGFSTGVSFGLIALQTDDTFRRHRRVLSPAMASAHLANFVPRITDAFESLLALWRIKAAKADGCAFAVREDLGAALLDVSTSLAFGEAMGNMASTMALVAGLDHAPPADASGGVTFPSGSTPLVADLRVLFDAIGSVLQHSFPRLGRLLIRATPTFRRANRRVSAYLERRASDAQAALDSGGLGEASVDNVLDLLLIRAGQPANHMPMDELRDELLTFVLAGADTTAIAIGWALKHLSRRPDIQHRLHAEVCAQLPSPDERQPTQADLQNGKLPYLEAVIYETLRIARVANIGTRQATVETTLLGHRIPAGTPVALLFGLAGLRDESDADLLDPLRSESSRKSGPRRRFGADYATFEPARWLREDGTFDPNAGSWIPFGGGIRGCFGKALALLDLRLFFAMLSLSVFLDPVDAALDTDRCIESITHGPREVFIRPRPW